MEMILRERLEATGCRVNVFYHAQLNESPHINAFRKGVCVEEIHHKWSIVWAATPLIAKFIIGENASLPAHSDKLVLVLDVCDDIFDDANS